MAINILAGGGPGVDKLTIGEGEGSSQPQLSAAVSTAFNAVRFTFNTAMGDDDLLDERNYSVVTAIGSTPLALFRVTRVGPNIVEATTEDQEDVDYDVTVTGVVDAYGQPINPSFNTATFAGIPFVGFNVSRLDLFYGLSEGMQAETADILGPIVTPVAPLASEPGIVLTSTVELEIEDETFLNQSSIKVYLDRGSGEELSYDGGVFQPGFDDVLSAVVQTTTTATITIDPTTSFPGTATITVRAEGIDISGNPVQLPDSYTFSTEEIVELVSATPLDFERIRIVYTSDMTIGTGPASAADPDNYTITGSTGPLEIVSITALNNNIFDVYVTEMRDGTDYTIIADGTVASISGTVTVADSIIANPDADRASFVGIADLPKLLEVTQVSAGVLNVDFSEAMQIDAALEAIETYQVTALSGSPLFITGVTTSTTLPTRVVLTYEGGSSAGVYRMTVTGVGDLVGNLIDPTYNSVVFKLALAIEDELFTGEQYYFDTDLGAISLKLNTISTRKIEDLVILRAQSVGYAAQFQLISNSLKYAGVNRDDQKLNLFKG